MTAPRVVEKGVVVPEAARLPDRIDDRVRLAALGRGLLAILRDLPLVLRGVAGNLRIGPDRKVSIGSLFADLAARYPDRLAVICGARRYTYAAFNAWANRQAAAFTARGIGPGDVVAIHMENRAEALAAVLATVKLGAIAAMLNHQQRGEILSRAIALVSPRLIVVGEECVEALGSTPFLPGGAEPAIPCLFDGDGDVPARFGNLRAEAAAQADENPSQTASVLGRTPAFYVFTSGTSGLPKAAIMSHLRWCRVMNGMGRLALRLAPDDVLYCCLPFYHNNALTVSWGSVIGSGAALAIGRKFSASGFWADIDRNRATAFTYIGELCRYLLDQPTNSADATHGVRAVIGNGLRPEIWDRFQTRFGIRRIVEFYGASEGVSAFINAFDVPRTAGFCPNSFAILAFDTDTETVIRDGSKGLAVTVPKGGTGLLAFRIDDRSRFDGYADRAANDARLLRDVKKRGDLWFNTGDLVRDQGYRHIAFVDRVGDTFRWKGENVATTEVEGVIDAYPGIREAVVYGVRVPGADGRAGMAAITVAPDCDIPGLAAHLASRLPGYAMPLYLRVCAAHEITTTFKLKKSDLKTQGFDRTQVTDPLYALEGGTYVRL